MHNPNAGGHGLARLATKLRRLRNALRYRWPGMPLPMTIYATLLARTPQARGFRAFAAWCAERMEKQEENEAIRLAFRGNGFVLGATRLPASSPEVWRSARASLIHVLHECLYCPIYFSPMCQVRPGETVLDIGASNGGMTLHLARRVGPTGRVHSFEPADPAREALAWNIRANQLSNVTVHACAVDASSGEGMMDWTPGRFEAAHLNRRPEAGSNAGHRVDIKALDDLDLGPVAYVKFDIEGAEEGALRGGERLIRTRKPRLSLASYHIDPQGEAQHPKLVKLLQSWGYRTCEMGQWHIFAWHPEGVVAN